jgi:hypothetical protein
MCGQMHTRCVALAGMSVRAQAPIAFLACPGGLAGRVRAPTGINGNLFQTVHLISTVAGAASAFAARARPGGPRPSALVRGTSNRKINVYAVLQGRTPGIYAVRSPGFPAASPMRMDATSAGRRFAGPQGRRASDVCRWPACALYGCVQSWAECQEQVSGFPGAVFKKLDASPLLLRGRREALGAEVCAKPVWCTPAGYSQTHLPHDGVWCRQQQRRQVAMSAAATPRGTRKKKTGADAPTVKGRSGSGKEKQASRSKTSEKTAAKQKTKLADAGAVSLEASQGADAATGAGAAGNDMAGDGNEPILYGEWRLGACPCVCTVLSTQPQPQPQTPARTRTYLTCGRGVLAPWVNYIYLIPINYIHILYKGNGRSCCAFRAIDEAQSAIKFHKISFGKEKQASIRTIFFHEVMTDGHDVTPICTRSHVHAHCTRLDRAAVII